MKVLKYLYMSVCCIVFIVTITRNERTPVLILFVYCSFCLESSLNSTKVQGKVLICRNTGSSSESKLGKSIVVRKAGGVGMVLIDEGDNDVAIPFVIPGAIVGQRVGDKILSYVNHTRFVFSFCLCSSNGAFPDFSLFLLQGNQDLLSCLLEQC